MSILNSIITEKQPQPPPIGIVYGLPGIGKTTFGASLKDCLIIDCENGANHVDCDKTPYLKEWQHVKDVVNALIFEEHNYKTIVVDSLDWCFRLMISEIIGDSIIGEAKGGFGKGYQYLEKLVRKPFIPMFNELNRRKNVAVIFLAHAKQESVEDADGLACEKICPDIPCGKKDNPYVRLFTEWVDFVFYMREIKNERIFQTKGTPRTIAKCRYPVPDKIKITEFNKYLIDTKTETEKE